MTTNNSTATKNTPATNEAVAVLDPDDGANLHFLNNLATIKVAPGSTGSMSVVEFLSPRGFGPPLHCHRDEDELVVVLDGEVEFRSGDETVVASAGACAYLPHGIPHTFQVLSTTARMLSVTSSAVLSPQFDRMVTALGEPTDEPTLPPETEIDPGHVALISGEHGVDILGPPPAPLAD